MTFSHPLKQPDWPHLSLLTAAFLFPIGLALLLSLLVPAEPSDNAIPTLQAVSAKSSQRLEALFANAGYSWPPAPVVPALGISGLPGDMAALDVERKKALFLRSVLPLVLAENARLRQERRWLEKVMSRHGDLSKRTVDRLQRLAREYGLDPVMLEPEALLLQLHQRIDVVPVGLVLAQAANESGWGTSRFSREANNLFGEWTYRAEHGVVPQQRSEGARHFVRRFADLRASVRSYLHNLNSGRAYAPLRTLRAQMRREGRELDPLQLARGLVRYSARGEDYVAEIRAMIRANGLNALGPLRLDR